METAGPSFVLRICDVWLPELQLQALSNASELSYSWKGRVVLYPWIFFFFFGNIDCKPWQIKPNVESGGPILSVCYLRKAQLLIGYSDHSKTTFRRAQRGTHKKIYSPSADLAVVFDWWCLSDKHHTWHFHCYGVGRNTITVLRMKPHHLDLTFFIHYCVRQRTS